MKLNLPADQLIVRLSTTMPQKKLPASACRWMLLHAMEAVDALDFPQSEFVSSSVTEKGDSLIVAGKLTFHGVTKDIIIHAYKTLLNNTLTITGNFDISLTAFKVERPSLLFIPVKDKLEFSLKQIFKM